MRLTLGPHWREGFGQNTHVQLASLEAQVHRGCAEVTRHLGDRGGLWHATNGHFSFGTQKVLLIKTNLYYTDVFVCVHAQACV